MLRYPSPVAWSLKSVVALVGSSITGPRGVPGFWGWTCRLECWQWLRVVFPVAPCGPMRSTFRCQTLSPMLP
jgi:hypothetical protein